MDAEKKLEVVGDIPHIKIIIKREAFQKEEAALAAGKNLSKLFSQTVPIRSWAVSYYKDSDFTFRYFLNRKITEESLIEEIRNILLENISKEGINSFGVFN